MTCVQKKGEAMIDKDHHHTIIRIPDKLWNEIRLILPKEKPFKTIGRPIVPYRKVSHGNLLHPKNRMPVENATLRVWFWFYLSQIDSMNGINWMFSKRCGLNH